MLKISPVLPKKVSAVLPVAGGLLAVLALSNGMGSNL